LSVKWHRHKKRSKWFNARKDFNEKYEVEDQRVNQTFQIKNRWVKRQAYPYNRCPKSHRKRGWKELEPLVDVLEEKDEIIVVAEFAGFKRENIEINVKDRKLDLSADASDRKYHKSLNFPKRVIPNTVHTKYKNGVLEIRLKKAPEEEAIGRIVG